MATSLVHQTEVPSWMDAMPCSGSTSVGRLCVIDLGRPVALPVSFRLVGEPAPRIVMRTSSTGVLARYEGAASFEADHIDEQAHTAWSVVVHGELRHAYADRALPDPEPWLGDGRHLWLVLDVAAISGRFAGTPDEDGFAVDWTVPTSAPR